MAASDAEMALFRLGVIDLLHLKRPKVAWTLASDPEAVVSGSINVYLGNLFPTLAGASPADRENGILAFFDSITTDFAVEEADAPTNFELARNQLRARVIHADYLEIKTELKNALLARPLSKLLRIAYVFANGSAMTFVTVRNMDQWAVNADRIHEVAIENLDGLSQNIRIETKTAPTDTGKYAVFAAEDSYNAARLVSPQFMLRLRKTLGQKIFIGVPSRGFMVAWSADFSRKAQFADVIADEVNTEKSYPLSDELFVSTDDGLRLATVEELRDHGRG